MNYFVIIRGPLGVGKITIFKKVASQLNANYFSVDEILSKNKLDKIDKKITFIFLGNFLKVDEIFINGRGLKVLY